MAPPTRVTLPKSPLMGWWVGEPPRARSFVHESSSNEEFEHPNDAAQKHLGRHR